MRAQPMMAVVLAVMTAVSTTVSPASAQSRMTGASFGPTMGQPRSLGGWRAPGILRPSPMLPPRQDGPGEFYRRPVFYSGMSNCPTIVAHNTVVGAGAGLLLGAIMLPFAPGAYPHGLRNLTMGGAAVGLLASSQSPACQRVHSASRSVSTPAW